MGVEGTLEYLSTLLSSVKKRKKKKQIQIVALKVKMDCEGCVRKVKQVLSRVKGFALLSINALLQFFNEKCMYQVAHWFTLFKL